MKRLGTALLFGVLSTAWFGCDNDLELTADWQDIPIVYGLLDINDPVHFIRLEKAFLDPQTSALTIAQIPDSLYYESATVQLERLSDGSVFTLQRVDGTTIGLPKEEGIFASEPNYLYMIDSASIDLQPGEEIRLLINRGDEKPLVTATTTIVPKLEPRRPVEGTNINFDYVLNTRIRWDSPDEAKIFDVVLYLNILEFPKNDPSQQTERRLKWELARGLVFEANELTDIEFPGLEFYLFLQKNLEEDDGISRVFQGIDIEVTAAGQELKDFIRVIQANTGITASQEVPTFTNLSEGRGIFSSRSVLRVNGIQLSGTSRDSLRNGIHTKDLNFL
ncbi:MAG: DUF4249 family protein [Bacteroidetes bacterium]|nr:MAG: DUF4249 family protein [Bacteroidota bacterium]